MTARRALHLVTSLDRGGIERWLIDLIGPMASHGWGTDFLCKSHEGEWASEARERGSEVTVLRLTPSHLRYVRGVRRILDRGRHQLVHSHLEAYSGLGALAARGTGVPVISMFHNTSFEPQVLTHPLQRGLRRPYAAASVRFALRRSAIVAGCSVAALESLPPVGSAPREVLRLGIPDLPEEPHGPAPQPSGTVTLVHVGRFVRQKNHLALLDLFQEAWEADQRLVLVMVGDGPERPTIAAKLARLPCRRAVQLVGARDDARRIIAEADIALLPSLHEGFGLVALEAAAAGVPVVGSAIPGLDEAVVHGTTGFLYPSQQVSMMAGKVLELAASPRLRQQVGVAAQSHFRKHFSIEVSAAAVADCYERVLGMSTVEH